MLAAPPQVVEQHGPVEAGVRVVDDVAGARSGGGVAGGVTGSGVTGSRSQPPHGPATKAASTAYSDRRVIQSPVGMHGVQK